MSERLVLLLVLVLAIVVAVAVTRAVVARRTRARLGRALSSDLPLDHPEAPTILYFHGPACPACATQRKALEVLRREHAALNVLPVDAAIQPSLTAWAGVLTVPSTALIDRERRLRQVNHGFRSAADLATQIAALI